LRILSGLAHLLFLLHRTGDIFCELFCCLFNGLFPVEFFALKFLTPVCIDNASAGVDDGAGSVTFERCCAVVGRCALGTITRNEEYLLRHNFSKPPGLVWICSPDDGTDIAIPAGSDTFVGRADFRDGLCNVFVEFFSIRVAKVLDDGSGGVGSPDKNKNSPSGFVTGVDEWSQPVRTEVTVDGEGIGCIRCREVRDGVGGCG